MKLTTSDDTLDTVKSSAMHCVWQFMRLTAKHISQQFGCLWPQRCRNNSWWRRKKFFNVINHRTFCKKRFSTNIRVINEVAVLHSISALTENRLCNQNACCIMYNNKVNIRNVSCITCMCIGVLRFVSSSFTGRANMGVTGSNISASRAEILESKQQRGNTYYLFDCI